MNTQENKNPNTALEDRRTFAKSESTPLLSLYALFYDKDGIVYKNAIYNSNVKANDLIKLFKFKEFQEPVLCNPNCPSEIIDQVLKSNHALNKAIIAFTTKNENTFNALMKEDNYFIKYNMVKNRYCPNHIIKALSKDRHIKVRNAIAQICRDSEILADMLNDKEDTVLLSLVNNPAILFGNVACSMESNPILKKIMEITGYDKVLVKLMKPAVVEKNSILDSMLKKMNH